MDMLNEFSGMTYDPDILKQYGRKGMKWYQNIFTKPGSLSAKRAAKKAERDAEMERKKQPASTRKSAKELSDDELRIITNRIQLEQKYNQLTAPKQSAGQKFLASVLSDASKQVATKYTAKYMTLGLEALEKAIKDEGLKTVKKK